MGTASSYHDEYSLLLSLFAARKSLEVCKSLVQSDTSVTIIKKSVQVLDTIGSSTFWMKIDLISELLRPLKIEIGALKRKGSKLLGVVQILADCLLCSLKNIEKLLIFFKLYLNYSNIC